MNPTEDSNNSTKIKIKIKIIKKKKGVASEKKEAAQFFPKVFFIYLQLLHP